MKRSYEEMASSLSALPSTIVGEARVFKSSLNGAYRLRVVEVLDISKAKEKPIEDIDEPEDQQDAARKRMDKNNARMIQLKLQDSNGKQVNALETERIDLLSNLKRHWTVDIMGPADIRCGNIMLEKRHVKSVEPPSDNDVENKPQVIDQQMPHHSTHVAQIEEDWDEADEQDCITID